MAVEDKNYGSTENLGNVEQSEVSITQDTGSADEMESSGSVLDYWGFAEEPAAELEANSNPDHAAVSDRDVSNADSLFDTLKEYNSWLGSIRD